VEKKEERRKGTGSAGRRLWEYCYQRHLRRCAYTA